MRAFVVSMFLFAAACNSCLASEAENQAESFVKIYASLCIKNLSHLEELRGKLKNVPKLPPEEAAQFLSGNEGDAWSVPDKSGTFVIALPSKKNLCMVYARKADATKAERVFTGLVVKAPSPLISQRIKAERTAGGDPTHTIAYEWSVPNATRRMLFTLTTTSSDKAPLQGFASAAMISN